MKLLKTKISGLKLVKTNIYKDKRGLLKEIYRKKILKKDNFILDIIST